MRAQQKWRGEEPLKNGPTIAPCCFHHAPSHLLDGWLAGAVGSAASLSWLLANLHEPTASLMKKDFHFFAALVAKRPSRLNFPCARQRMGKPFAGWCVATRGPPTNGLAFMPSSIQTRAPLECLAPGSLAAYRG